MVNTVIELLTKLATVVAASSNFNPLLSCLVVILFYIAFSVVEGFVEELVFGKSFVHWLDPFFASAFTAFAAFVVWICAAAKV